MNAVTYPVKIRFEERIEDKLSLFTVLDYKVVNTSLKVLISYQRHSEVNPEVEAVWEACQCRLFLICRKWEAHQIDFSTGFCSPPKDHIAWIDIDLTPLSLNKKIYVYTHQLAQRMGLEVGQGSFQVRKAYDELVAKIRL